MGHKHTGRKSEKTSFQLEGRFLGFVVKDGYKIKGLNLATSAGELYIKLSKEARASCQRVLVPGEWLRVSGEQQLDYGEGVVKFKADRIQVAVPGAERSGAERSGAELERSPALPMLPDQPIAPTPRAGETILFCQKSDCCKRGGWAVTEALQKALGDRQLEGQVKLKGTGCMKQCKAGPNVIIQKTRYSRIRPEDVPQLIDRHFPKALGQPASAIASAGSHPQP
ncbi:MAG: OB-fold nucleic acid binding domain-containing protein [Cyanobacteria bacterium J069]|nr:MAG: (2Fe-2S) ferredoxin domain-containing protein [Cyanobacteria bacterium J069]